MNAWAEAPKSISHPDIKFPVDANLYLGYGPLTRNKEAKKTTFKDKLNAAIQAEESNALKIIYADGSNSAIQNTLQIIHWLGTVGSRSRNGWGSLEFGGDGVVFKPLEQNNPLLQVISRPLEKCLELDWTHALGNDDKGLLIWRTKENYVSWREAMKDLAKIKIAFRTSLKFNRHNGQMDCRHLLAYPVTNHPVSVWGNQKRLANQLRFKVTKTAQGYIGVAYHLPCGIPSQLLNALTEADRNWIVKQQLGVWQKVHGILDQQMQRI